MTNVEPAAGAKAEPDQTVDVQTELDAMKKVAEALNSLPNAEGRLRVLVWAQSSFGVSPGTVSTAFPPQRAASTEANYAGQKELPGIARITETGEFHLTIRDLKASSANDAAIRISHVAILANEQLSGQTSISSKTVLVPMLRKFRAYDSNTRKTMARHRGLLREGDNISLDAYCKQEAETFMKEILDPTSHGSWNPFSQSARKRSSQVPDTSPTRETA